MSSEKLEGVIIAIPTPLTKEENIDVCSLKNLLEYCVGEGANGIMILGTMGEGAALLDKERKTLINTTVEQVGGRIPILATASAVSTRKTIQQAIEIDRSGVDYIVCTSPFYYKYPDPESLLTHMERIDDAVERPLIFYNAPIFTGNPVSTDLLEKILNMKNVVGIKDSSCNYSNFVQLLRNYPDKNQRPGTIMQGDESVFDSSLLFGADGIISGGGVAFIRLLKQLYTAAITNDRLNAMKHQNNFTTQLLELLSPNPQRNWVYSIKKRLADKNIITNPYVTAPFLS
ncbi:4-hydroxy-tetrahydrodipicolinate synthase [Pedobacter sp. AK017]|uniref:dihydrodipicolinate synthase family protein n=1 Tax=Pedobacter sp. AK017 TaxID=2723073 RepID=UPI001613A2DB|nr:dihydrodipicolinate synthase family protein [Pedobacter sp. AK017]MBB5439976.1 4-hydroxy-tetrahydrodipicolinate synthase [Pedobacter sp. AK017]